MPSPNAILVLLAYTAFMWFSTVRPALAAWRQHRDNERAYRRLRV